MTEQMLEFISQKFALEPIDTGEYKKLRVNGMNFNIRAYRAKGLGHISVMTASGFCGLMRMDTLIINPTEVDMPLLSYDRVYAMGNDTLIFELYDTLLDPRELSALQNIKDRAAALPDHELGEHWYDPIKLSVSFSKKGKKVHTADFDSVSKNYLFAFLGTAQDAAFCDRAAKLEKASVYVNGLLGNGGPSTDIFKKSLGCDKTTELFECFLFGIK